MAYQLTVRKVENSCLFELNWGQGQHVEAIVPYPEALLVLLTRWRRAYANYYRKHSRGRRMDAGQGVSQHVDWHGSLIQAEARLLAEFYKWLAHVNLQPIRTELIRRHGDPQASGSSFQAKSQSVSSSISRPELFLVCNALELARLPWESWEIVEGLGRQFSIVRMPSTISSATTTVRQKPRTKTRVLAILGGDERLTVQGDRATLKAQEQLLDVHYIGWKPGDNVSELREEILNVLAAPEGWDILFFAGHSNEETAVDGQIFIAPNASLSISELSAPLKEALKHGLKFAIFNSCSGLDIANKLIDTGLGQVAIIREPIRNDVAQCFLADFLQRLSHFQNTQEALQGTCQFLEAEKKQTYPSAYLTPSLFRHPESVPFKVRPFGWRERLRPWLLSKRQVAFVSAVTLLSLIPPVQERLLDARVMCQALYRDITSQEILPDYKPIVLVNIDQLTLDKKNITDPSPIDPDLIASLIDELADHDLKVLGIDYVLDTPTEKEALQKSLIKQIEDNGLWTVFAARFSSEGEWESVYSHDTIALPAWSIEGDIYQRYWRISPTDYSQKIPTFGYQLALAYHLKQNNHSRGSLYPQISNRKSLQKNLSIRVRQPENNPLSHRAFLHPITKASDDYLIQRWLQPLLDFSIRPSNVYVSISASDILQDAEKALKRQGVNSLADRVVIIAPDGYPNSGFKDPSGHVTDDRIEKEEVPQALRYGIQDYWAETGRAWVTGGEIHSYMTHHFLTGWLVLPLPDFLIILAALSAGKTVIVMARLNRSTLASSTTKYTFLGGSILLYGLFTLQLYISTAVLLPWIFPSIAFYSCFLSLWSHQYAKS